MTSATPSLLLEADGAHFRGRREQGQHHLPSDAKGHHLAEGGAHQEVCIFVGVLMF